MNQAERIYRVHRELSPGRKITFERLREALEVSAATLKRDIRYMREFMDAPIQSDRDGSGYWYDPAAPAFELPGLWFNASELYALLASEQLLEAVQPGLLGPSLGPLKQRIRSLLAQSGHPGDTVTRHIRLQPMGLRAVDEAVFGQVAAATLQGRRLTFEYHGRQRGHATRRSVHPHRLLHYRDNWFLIAWCEQAGALRTFSLDRIRDAEEHATPIDPLPEHELDRHIGAAFGIFAGEAKAWAVLRFSPEAARWVADERWHPDQIGQWQEGHYQLQLPYSDPRELVMEILKYGPDVEVLAPDELRQEVAQRLQDALSNYL